MRNAFQQIKNKTAYGGKVRGIIIFSIKPGQEIIKQTLPAYEPTLMIVLLYNVGRLGGSAIDPTRPSKMSFSEIIP